VQLQELLVVPIVAGLLGFFVGASMIGVMAWSRTYSKSPDEPPDTHDSIVAMMGSMVGGMLISSALMIAYVVFAQAGFVYFGLSLAAGFVIGLGIISVVLWRQSFRD